MFFFPYGTDAPMYHWPVATVLMIVVCIGTFCAQLRYPEQSFDYILTFGNGLHPLQWITANFMHAGFMHLIGNIFCLWAFGLVIEGKLGFFKTLAISLIIGSAQCAIVQFVMLGSHDLVGGLGASGIIFGLMAMCLIWAPENNMQCVFVFFVRPYEFELSIISMVGLMLLLQIMVLTATGVRISSEAVHLIGASIGFGISIAMLKAGLVDCENWDAFSVWAGRHTMTEAEREKEYAEKDSADRQENAQNAQESALKEIREIIKSERPLLALKAHQRMASEFPNWALSQDDSFLMIQALHKQELWAESIPLMAEHLKNHPLKSAAMRLKLAHILVVARNTPAQALKVMAKIDETELDGRLREFLAKLRAKANQLHDQDPYEIAEFDW
jgi:membrane associated rhomboid family serine protease